MAVTNKKSVYPFAECIEVTTEGTTSIGLMDIPAGALIEKVLVRVKVAAGSAVNLKVGDDTNAIGFIETAASGTIGVYGEDLGSIAASVVGDYLARDSTDTTPLDRVPKAGKFYASAGKEVKLALASAPTAPEAQVQVIVIGKRYQV